MKYLQRELLRQPDAELSPDVGILKFATVERDGMLEPQRRVRVVASTDAADRENDVIDQAGWQLDNYRANPVILFAHDYCSLPVAKAVSVATMGSQLVIECEFATAEQNPFADVCYKLVQGGFLNAVSVGFRPLKWNYDEVRNGVDFLQQELLELSFVPVPAHPQALVTARDAGLEVGLLKEWAEGVLKRLGEDSEKSVTETKSAPVVDEKSNDTDLNVDKTAQVIAALIKQGRVLSATNESKIRSAVASLSDVLSALEAEPIQDALPQPDKKNSQQVQKSDAQDEDVLDVEHSTDKQIDEQNITLSDQEIAALRTMIVSQVKAQITQLTGRVS